MPTHFEQGLPDHLLATLMSTTPWDQQVQSLNHLTTLALTPSPHLLRQLRHLAPYFQSAINNPRSTLVRSVCETITMLAETLRAPFVEAVGNEVIPDLLSRAVVTKAVIRDSCINAARTMFECGVEGVHFATVKMLSDAVADRRAAAPRRGAAAVFLGLILVDNCREGVQYIYDAVASAIAAGCADPDEGVRKTSRENWRKLRALDSDIAAQVLRNLAPYIVQLIHREAEEAPLDFFRGDRSKPSRVTMSADVPVRPAPRGLLPGRVEISTEETPMPATRKRNLRPPRRSVAPGALLHLLPISPGNSPPRRNDMQPGRVRRVYSPMAVDTPAPVETPARGKEMFMDAGSSPKLEKAPNVFNAPAPVKTPLRDKETFVKAKTSPELLKTPAQLRNYAKAGAGEKSTVSPVSSSTGSQSTAREDAFSPLPPRTEDSSPSSVADTCENVSAVSSATGSPVASSASSASNNTEDTSQKIDAESGASRRTNQETGCETPPLLPQPALEDRSLSVHGNVSPEAKKGRLSFILGANRTPGLVTPLPSVSRLAQEDERKEFFTPMDICTPMKYDGVEGGLSGVVAQPLARTLNDRLDEAAKADNKTTMGEVNGSFTPLVHNELVLPKTNKEELNIQDLQGLQDDGEIEAIDAVSDNVKEDDLTRTEKADKSPLATEQECAAIEPPVESTEISLSSHREELEKSEKSQPNTPDSLDDEDILRRVASISESAEKKGDISESGTHGEPSWDTLVQDLEKTLGLTEPMEDESVHSESAKELKTLLQTIEGSCSTHIMSPGSGEKNESSEERKQPTAARVEEPKAKVKVQDAEKTEMAQAERQAAKVKVNDTVKTEMTQAERQAALARRPPRRSLHPGALPPRTVEKKNVRTSFPPAVTPAPPRLQRRKPPVPIFERTPSVAHNRTAGSSSTDQLNTTARKAPTSSATRSMTARKFPQNRARVSTVSGVPTATPAANRTLPQSSRPNSSTARTPARASTARTLAAVSTKTPAPVRKAGPVKTGATMVSALPPKPAKAAGRKQTPQQAAVIEAYRTCARAKTGNWSMKWSGLEALVEAIKDLQGESLHPRLCDDVMGVLGDYLQETRHRVQLSALDAVFFLLLCTETGVQTSALQRALDKRPEMLRRILSLAKDGREDVRLGCARVMQGYEVLFGPEVQVGLLLKAVSGQDGKIAEMGCVHMLRAFERAKQGDGFVWKTGLLEGLVVLLGGLTQNRRIEVRQGGGKVVEAVKECLPDRAFEIVCRKCEVRL